MTIKVNDVVLESKNNETVLKTLERYSEFDKLIGCRRGGCGICKIRVIKGSFSELKMSKGHISEEDRQENIVLACCIKPNEDLEIEIL